LIVRQSLVRLVQLLSWFEFGLPPEKACVSLSPCKAPPAWKLLVSISISHCAGGVHVCIVNV
jgi:hypothetical protein